MIIAIASDHAGFRYKEILKSYLEKSGHEVVDFGTDSESSVDYPRFIQPAAKSVVRGDCERLIVLGGSGNGEAMAANRFKGIRCALCWDETTARLARSHNDANGLSLGQRLISIERAIDIVDCWLETEFEQGRHVRRIQMLDQAD
ncbi:MAG: ribose 5-phosphate isomerase B [Acidobacteriota bacterium]